MGAGRVQQQRSSQRLREAAEAYSEALAMAAEPAEAPMLLAAAAAAKLAQAAAAHSSMAAQGPGRGEEGEDGEGEHHRGGGGGGGSASVRRLLREAAAHYALASADTSSSSPSSPSFDPFSWRHWAQLGVQVPAGELLPGNGQCSEGSSSSSAASSSAASAAAAVAEARARWRALQQPPEPEEGGGGCASARALVVSLAGMPHGLGSTVHLLSLAASYAYLHDRALLLPMMTAEEEAEAGGEGEGAAPPAAARADEWWLTAAEDCPARSWGCHMKAVSSCGERAVPSISAASMHAPVLCVRVLVRAVITRAAAHGAADLAAPPARLLPLRCRPLAAPHEVSSWSTAAGTSSLPADDEAMLGQPVRAAPSLARSLAQARLLLCRPGRWAGPRALSAWLTGSPG
eukprot:COSAG01_NODE_9756_length_2352_cov_1.732357_2_plen_402_part_00